jgi:hypothetical protein
MEASTERLWGGRIDISGRIYCALDLLADVTCCDFALNLAPAAIHARLVAASEFNLHASHCNYHVYRCPLARLPGDFFDVICCDLLWANEFLLQGVPGEMSPDQGLQP